MSARYHFHSSMFSISYTWSSSSNQIVKLFAMDLSTSYVVLLQPLVLAPPIVFYCYISWRQSKIPATWSKFYGDVKVLLPYLQSQDKAETRSTKYLLVAVLLCVALGRLLTVVSPLLQRSISTDLSVHDRSFPWHQILAYVAAQQILFIYLHYVQWMITRRLEALLACRLTIAVNE